MATTCSDSRPTLRTIVGCRRNRVLARGREPINDTFSRSSAPACKSTTLLSCPGRRHVGRHVDGPCRRRHVGRGRVGRQLPVRSRAHPALGDQRRLQRDHLCTDGIDHLRDPAVANASCDEGATRQILYERGALIASETSPAADRAPFRRSGSQLSRAPSGRAEHRCPPNGRSRRYLRPVRSR